MKAKYFLILFIMSLCLSTTSCIVTHPHKPHHHKEIPPGHKKKIHKKKSAKFFAPGHHKEHR